MATRNTVKAIRPNRLSEDETLTSFEDWRNNLEFYLHQDDDFTKFLDLNAEWKVTGENVERFIKSRRRETFKSISWRYSKLISTTSPWRYHK